MEPLLRTKRNNIIYIQIRWPGWPVTIFENVEIIFHKTSHNDIGTCSIEFECIFKSLKHNELINILYVRIIKKKLHGIFIYIEKTREESLK